MKQYFFWSIALGLTLFSGAFASDDVKPLSEDEKKFFEILNKRPLTDDDALQIQQLLNNGVDVNAIEPGMTTVYVADKPNEKGEMVVVDFKMRPLGIVLARAHSLDDTDLPMKKIIHMLVDAGALINEQLVKEAIKVDNPVSEDDQGNLVFGQSILEYILTNGKKFDFRQQAMAQFFFFEGVKHFLGFEKLLPKIIHLGLRPDVSNNYNETAYGYVFGNYKKGMTIGETIDAFLGLLDYVDSNTIIDKDKTLLLWAVEAFAINFQPNRSQHRKELLLIIEKLLQKGADPCEKPVQERVASSTSKELRALFEQYSMGCVMSACAQSLAVLATSIL